MRSKVFQRVLNSTYRKIKYPVDSYAEYITTGVKRRVNTYFSWKSFNLGFGFSADVELSGFKYMLSFDLGPLAIWIYFKEIKK